MEDCFSWGSIRKSSLERGARDVVVVPTKCVAVNRILRNRGDGGPMAWEVRRVLYASEQCFVGVAGSQSDSEQLYLVVMLS